MIPTLYLRLAGAVAIAMLLAGLYLKGRHDGAESERETQQVATAKAVEGIRAQEGAERARRDTIESDYLGRVRELETHRDQLMRAVPAVRVRQSASRDPAGAACTAPVIDAVPTGRESVVRDGEIAVSAEPDVSLSLVQLASRCESDRLTLISLQEWAAR